MFSAGNERGSQAGWRAQQARLVNYLYAMTEELAVVELPRRNYNHYTEEKFQ